jgi:molybdate transport repressor ModE-like protein
VGEKTKDSRIGVKTKIYLTGDDGRSFMGIGVLWLLQGIDSSGSMRSAAAEMHLSYAKAHRMIKDAEKGLGIRLIDRRHGGERREGATLTEEGRLLIKAYEAMQRDIKKDAEARFALFLSELQGLLAGRPPS